MRPYVLSSWWKKYERCWVTFRKEDALSLLTDEKVYWAYFPTNRNLKNMLLNTFLAWKILRKEQPDVIVSSGAGIAVPFFWIGRLLGMKLVYIEAIERIETPTITGKMVYPITDLFVLQWDEQKKFYPKGTVLGQLL